MPSAHNVLDTSKLSAKRFCHLKNKKRALKQPKQRKLQKKQQQNLEAFIRSTDLVQMIYTHILSELENVLLEKHDVMFHTCYISIQIDIQTMENKPEEPALAPVPIFEDIFFYKDVMEFMESKIGIR